MLRLQRESRFLIVCLFLFCSISLTQGFAPIGGAFHRTSPSPPTQDYQVTPLRTASAPFIEQFETTGEILDELVQTKARNPIILHWFPQRKAIWGRWRGTVFQTTAKPTFVLTCLSLILCLAAKRGDLIHSIGSPFATSDFFVALQRLDRLWQMQMTILSFILAFYLNTAKSLFDSVLAATRQLQGRLNDMNLFAASHAVRDTDGNMTADSRELCTTLGRYTRLFAVLFYAAQCRRYETLQSAEGLLGMQRRGLITSDESALLTEMDPNERYFGVQSWIMTTFTKGCEGESPLIRMPSNSHFAFMLRLADLRGNCALICDLVDARCPLAYVHLVQLLVDSFLFITPFAALGEMGWFSIGATFLLSLFFSGLMDLAKTLYDPLDNEEFGDIDNIQVDTLIQETNAGSLRFKNTAKTLPLGARPQ